VEAFNQHAREQGWPQQSLKEIPPPAQFSSLRAEYIVIEDEKHVAPADEQLIGLDALHVYYDANKQRLAEEYAQREAAEAERQQWLKDHPPEPKDIVVNYWRKPSERPTAGGTR
jgi:hypothetical protein